MSKTNPLSYLTKQWWRQSEGNHKNVILYTTMCIIAYTVESMEPLVAGWFLNTMQTEGVNEKSLPKIILILLLFPLKEGITWLFHGLARVIENKNAFYVKAKYKEYLLGGTLALPLEWHTDHHSGDTIDKIEKGSNALESFASQTFELLSTGIRLLVAIITLSIFNISGGLLGAFILFLTFYIVTRFDKVLVPGYSKVNQLENSISAKVFDTISNITTIIILRVDFQVLSSIKEYIQKPFIQYNKNSKVNEWKWFAAAMMGRIAVLSITLIYIIFEIRSGNTILAGTVFIVYGYAREIRESFYNLAGKYGEIVKWRAQVSNAELLSKDFKESVSGKARHLPKTWKTIKIENLSFSYHAENNADLHLDIVSTEIKKGKKIALIGHSGGGKTTFLKLIRDLYHPKNIKLDVDSKPIKGFSEISNSIALIPQDPEIFNTSIKENITLGVEYSTAFIKKHTDMARFTDVIERLPHKLNSSIVEKGVNLSGGEKQRLALARGLIASEDKEIILLDEPTSSVDFNNELAIYQNIFKAFPKKAIISSIHRLHLLSLFDTIYYFEGGKIIAQGNLEFLKQTSPEFQTLWNNYSSTLDQPE